MKTRAEVSEEKVRGGFYSPPQLVAVCLDRLRWLLHGVDSVRLLEPSAGDGAFLCGLDAAVLGRKVDWVTAIEPVTAEAAKCDSALKHATFDGEVIITSAIDWALVERPLYDAAVGNPPFVRFQFASDSTKGSMARLATSLGISFGGVSNLWIPVLLSALSRLRPGGAFAFIIPAECFTGISAGVVREWLTINTMNLRFDLFPPGSFPAVLQEVVVLSGCMRRRSQAADGRLRVHEHARETQGRSWEHQVLVGRETWTRYLLTPLHLTALRDATAMECVRQLACLAKFEVAAVTGANEFFSVDHSTVRAYDLERWVRPLLPRTRHARGLTYTLEDHRATLESGARGFLLDFHSNGYDPSQESGPREYMELGEALDLPSRYKCRIRFPWYEVPGVKPGRMMLSKRSHRYPRVILNEADVVTTDTIYRGWLLPGVPWNERTFVACFHNSLTLLTAEIEGRSFGGGVLELVPSEISRLSVPMVGSLGEEFTRLDELLRSSVGRDEGERVIHETDQLLARANLGVDPALMALLSEARLVLLQRRLDRNWEDRKPPVG